MPAGFYYRFGKRWFDTSCALCGLILLSPVFVLVALAIWSTSRGPVFFRQVRTGQFGKPFRIFKFRTMRSETTANGPLVTEAGDPRITPLGKWLRKTKVDELPQLINVLIGDMSLVGPRPEVPEYTATFTVRQRRILFAKPGVTGLTATVYPNEEELLTNQPDKEEYYLTTLLPAKLEIDIAYCENIRFRRDVQLIFQTLANIFARINKLKSPLLDTSEKQV